MLFRGRELNSDHGSNGGSHAQSHNPCCAICAGAGGTVLCVKSGGNAAEDATATTAAAVSPVSIQELHSNAHMDALPIQVVEDPF